MIPKEDDRPTRRATALGLAAAVLPAAAAAAADAPRRIVSLTPCLDAIVVNVADRGQIAAISHYARDANTSSIAQLARTLPITYGSAEEIVALRPDLVITGRHSSVPTRNALEQMGIRAVMLEVPETVETSIAQVEQIAALVGRPERGRALAARIRAAVQACAPPPGTPRLSALVFQANGFASAEGTLMDEMMRRAGFANAASRYGLKQTGNVRLEQLIADPPQVLLAGQLRPGTPTWADRTLNHPALAAVAGRIHRAVFPSRLMYCGGPVLIETARALTLAREGALAVRG